MQHLISGPVEIEFHRSATRVDVWPQEGGRKAGHLERPDWNGSAESADTWAAYDRNGRHLKTNCTIAAALAAIARDCATRRIEAARKRAANRAAFNALWSQYRYGSES